MTQLFLRFYLGIISILIVAWLIQGYVFRVRSETQNNRVIESALSGGTRLAFDRITTADPADLDKELKFVQSRFEYPVRIVYVPEALKTVEAERRLEAGEVVLGGTRVYMAMPDGEKVIEFGPLQPFVGPSQAEVFLGFGAVFALSAIAIAFLLRPVASQLNAVERTATSIAEGDLSARIDDTRSLGNLPLAKAFNSMADRTETLLRSQRELLQAVSHELRTPLARIQFATQLIETAKTDEERTKRLESVDNATQELDELVGELLTYARLDSETAEVDLELIDIKELMAELVDVRAPLHPAIDFQIETGNQTVQAMADRAGMARAIGNLLSNAARYAKSQVRLNATKRGETVLIHVDDDGPGIAEANREKVFHPFVRLDESTGTGTGLGLALVHRIVTSQGGTIAVAKSPLGGARFEMSLHTPS